MNSTSAKYRALSWRAALVLTLALLATACSAIQFSYNHADRLLAFTLNSYLDLTGEQEKQVKDRVNALMAWHRTTQLADYAQLISHEQSVAQRQVTAEDILSFQREFNARVIKIGDHAAPDIAAIALTFTPAQLRHLEREQADNNLKFAKENFGKSHSDYQEGRAKRFIERAEEWFGSLSREQKALVRKTMQTQPTESRAWALEREQRQRDILEVLYRIQREQPDAATATEWIRAYFKAFEEPVNPERRAALAAVRLSNAQLTAALANSCSPEQKQTIQKKLMGYRDDATALAAQKSG